MIKHAVPAVMITGILVLFVSCTGQSSNQEKMILSDSVSSPGNIAQTATDFSGNITGRFIMTGTNCAGFNFVSPATVLWTNEIACNDPDTLALRWLDGQTFLTKSTRRRTEACPPGIGLYKVISFDNKHLVLQSVWTGWNELKDETLEFDRQPE